MSNNGLVSVWAEMPNDKQESDSAEMNTLANEETTDREVVDKEVIVEWPVVIEDDSEEELVDENVVTEITHLDVSDCEIIYKSPSDISKTVIDLPEVWTNGSSKEDKLILSEINPIEEDKSAEDIATEFPLSDFIYEDDGFGKAQSSLDGPSPSIIEKTVTTGLGIFEGSTRIKGLNEAQTVAVREIAKIHQKLYIEMATMCKDMESIINTLINMSELPKDMVPCNAVHFRHLIEKHPLFFKFRKTAKLKGRVGK